MRHLFLLLFFITLITTHANEQQGYKVVLVSFSTFNEAKEKLALFDATLRVKKELALQETYHFEILARPSGKAFIIALEPFEKKESAEAVLHQFKQFYPDGYVNGYFGPTDGSVVWKHKSVDSATAKSDTIQTKTSDSVHIKPSNESSESHAWVWILIVVLIVIANGVLFFVRRGEKSDALKDQIIKYKEELKANFEIFVPWNYEDAMKRAGGDEESLNRAIELFLHEIPTLISDLKEAIEKGNFTAIQMRAHALKSASAQVSAVTLRMSSKKIEIAAREKNRPLVEVLFTEFETIVDKTLMLINERVVNPKDTIPSINKKTQLRAHLDFLRQNISKSLFVDVGHLSILYEVPDEKTAVLLEELKKSIEKLEYEKALELIERVDEMIK